MQKMWCKWKLNMQIDIYFIYFFKLSKDSINTPITSWLWLYRVKVILFFKIIHQPQFSL